jgi:hypothetical protein
MPTMPNVVGLVWQDAVASMARAGVRPVSLAYFQQDPCYLVFDTTKTLRPGFVLAQSPLAGVTVTLNAPVTLRVSEFSPAWGDENFGPQVEYPQCTFTGASAMPGVAMPGCMTPSQSPTQ